MRYLHEDAFNLDVLVVGLRGELEVTSMREQGTNRLAPSRLF